MRKCSVALLFSINFAISSGNLGRALVLLWRSAVALVISGRLRSSIVAGALGARWGARVSPAIAARAAARVLGRSAATTSLVPLGSVAPLVMSSATRGVAAGAA